MSDYNYLYSPEITDEDRKHAFNAIEIAVRCGVNREYATAWLADGNYDLFDSHTGTAFDAAHGIIYEYNATYSTPENPQPASWATYRSLKKRR